MEAVGRDMDKHSLALALVEVPPTVDTGNRTKDLALAPKVSEQRLS